MQIRGPPLDKLQQLGCLQAPQGLVYCYTAPIYFSFLFFWQRAERRAPALRGRGVIEFRAELELELELCAPSRCRSPAAWASPAEAGLYLA